MLDSRNARRGRAWLLAAGLGLLATACASIRIGEERDAYFGKQLASYAYPRSCMDLWPTVLKLLGSKGYPLQGRDRAYAGQPPEGGFKSLVDQGYVTEPTADGGLRVKTGWSDSAEGASQYLVMGSPAGPAACFVTFTGRARDTVDPATIVETPDWKMQLELLRRVDPDAAARMESGAPTK
jgi:hypothetical protein